MQSESKKPLTDQQKMYIRWITEDYPDTYKGMEDKRMAWRFWEGVLTALGLVFIVSVAVASVWGFLR